MAVSALRSTSLTLSPVTAAAMPTLAVTNTSLPLSMNGCAMELVSRSIRACCSSGPVESSIRMANSSPPSRATVSAARAQERKRSAASDQQLVALAVPEAVVDLLEVVEVEEEHGDRVPLPLRELEGVIHAIAEQRAVGEAGERVVEGLVQQLLLEALPLGDVPGVEHDAVHDRVAEKVGGDHLGMQRRTLGLQEAQLGGCTDAAGGRRFAEEGLGARAIVGIDEREAASDP